MRAPTGLAGRRVAVLHWRDPWHSLAGGAERYAWEYALALRDAGAHVEFVTARDVGQRPDEVCDGIRLRRKGSRFTWYLHAWIHLLVLRVTRRSYDAVVESECGIPVFAPLVCSRRTSVVLVMHHVHQEQFRAHFPWPVSEVGRWLESRAMPYVYRRVVTVAVSGSTRREMTRQLGWTSPVRIVANGADAPSTAPDPGLDTSGRVLVLGRLVAHKRVDLVIRAVGRIPALRLDVVGAGPDEPRLRALVAELGLGDRVVVHGFLAEAAKQDLLRAARLHVCGSDAEGWGLVVVEAAAYGLPTLARDVPGLRDSIRPGLTGWLVDTAGQDHDQVVAALGDAVEHVLAVLDDPARREQVASACRSWAAGFTWERMHDEACVAVLDALDDDARRSP